LIAIEQLRELVDLSKEDEALIAEYRQPMQLALQDWAETLVQWLHAKTGAVTSPEALLLADYLESFLRAPYDRRFVSIQYHQSLHWLHLGIDLSHVLGALSQIRQFFIQQSQNCGQMDLAHALCRVIDLSQAIHAGVTHLQQTLEKLRQSAEHEIKHVVRNCNVVLFSDQDTMAQAYVAHYRWKLHAYSLALDYPLEEYEAPIDPHECELGRWLDKGGIKRFPEETREGLLAAHERLHHLMAIIRKKARKGEPEEIYPYLSDVEAASEEISIILGDCIQKEVRQLALEDSLSGLGNRRLFEREIHRWIAHAERHHAPFGLLFIDLDHFKEINDRYSHRTGDMVLKSVARLLQEVVRGDDVVFRWGGDEFIALARSSSPEELRQLAQRLRKKTERLSISSGQEPVQTTVSIGASLYIPGKDDADSVFKRADQHLNEAKAQGRNRDIVKGKGA